nr:nuclease-related domain-containing protein [Novacetimonas pomaceti]
MTAHEARVWRSFRAAIQGEKGESAVAHVLDLSGLAVLHNAILPTGDGRMTQIDRLFLSPRGIHVVETKRYGGELTEHTEDERWRQRFAGEAPDAPPRLIYSPVCRMPPIAGPFYALTRLVDPTIHIFSHVAMTGTAVLSPALVACTLSLSGLETLLHGLERNVPRGTLIDAWRRIGLACHVSGHQ